MQKIFVNGTILTMSGQYPNPEAVLVENGKIAVVGTREEVAAKAGKRAKIVDLKGRTLMPGFVDAHGHFISTALSKLYFVDVRCAPIGKIKTIEQLIAVMKGSVQMRKGKGMIVGFGYDDTLCSDERMLEAADLDKISKERPVIVIHASFHVVMANTKAMQLAGVDRADFTPEEGVVRRRNGVAIGVFEEVAAIRPLMELVYSDSMLADLPGKLCGICEEYLKQGVTTICEGANGNDRVSLIQKAMRRGRFPARYIVCPSLTSEGEVPKKIRGKHIINGPVKLLMDGSIQCYTAALSKPYATTAPGHEGDKDYCGSTYMSVEALRGKLETILSSSRSFAIHSNGDVALDKIIEALEGCENLERNRYKRNLIIHCQVAREEQLDKFKALNLYPSFFPAHLHVWGDRHYSTFLGEERAQRLDPVGSAVKRGLPFSLHNDSPVTETKPMEAVWNAVTRRTKKGRILGEEQRISVEEALKGVTLYAAFQYKAEDILGSIEPGKMADFIALDKNPLAVEPDELLNIQTQRVWVDGKIVWSAAGRTGRARKALVSKICKFPDFFSANCHRWLTQRPQ